jgi:hypothetical protein
LHDSALLAFGPRQQAGQVQQRKDHQAGFYQHNEKVNEHGDVLLPENVWKAP